MSGSEVQKLLVHARYSFLMFTVWGGIMKKIIHYIKPIIICLAGAALLFLLFDRLCILSIVTGLPCPGCGMSRALTLLLKGDFAGAWNMNPGIYGFIILSLYITYALIRRVPEHDNKLFNCLIYIIGGLMIFRYIYGMIMYFPDREPFVYRDSCVLSFVVSFLKRLFT